jgi:UDP-GlcNAc3NAcA epimerase
VKILTVLGARPQFIKAAAVSRAVQSRADSGGDGPREVIVHTGQHFDGNMSQVFFDQLGIPRPAHNLGISGLSHGAMTGRMLEGIEALVDAERPDWVLVYGDTNSTLAGALAATKLHVPVAHVEAGLRSFNTRMPEEINRVVVDRISTALFCPTATAVDNLRAEGVTQGVHDVGDVMYDVALFYAERAGVESDCLRRLGVEPRGYALVTWHRPENTDDIGRLRGIVSALEATARHLPLVVPLHPRTRMRLMEHGLLDRLAGVIVTEPLPYLDMVLLEQSARMILTDSGGVQKEAFFYQIPCITMRDETEWTETVALGANRLVGASPERIVAAAEDAMEAGFTATEARPYGTGDAAERIVEVLMRAALR